MITTIRRRPWLSATAACFFVMLAVPIVPFVPECDSPHSSQMEPIDGDMNPLYAEHLKGWFDDLGVYYWHIGDWILIRMLPFLDGSEYFDQLDAIVNSEKKAVGNIVYDYIERIKTGERPGEGPDAIPQQIFALLDPKMGKPTVDYWSCPMMRLVITGQTEP